MLPLLNCVRTRVSPLASQRAIRFPMRLQTTTIEKETSNGALYGVVKDGFTFIFGAVALGGIIYENLGVNDIKSKIAGIENKIDGVEIKIAGVEIRLEKKIAGVENKIAGVETRLENLASCHSSRMDTLYNTILEERKLNAAASKKADEKYYNLLDQVKDIKRKMEV